MPEETNYHTILDMVHIFLIFIRIIWDNQHNIFQFNERINRKILWANLHLLFWLSLIPFAASMIGEHQKSYIPFAIYGFVLLMISINILIVRIINIPERDFPLKTLLYERTKQI